jgi:predicted nucleic acid-binding protein
VIVADCSAVVFLLTDAGPTGDAIGARLATEDRVAAPHLLDYEVASALLGLARGRRGGAPKISARQLDRAIQAFRDLPVDRHETLLLWDRVRDLAANLSPYDAQYVALAEALGVPLITSDARIARSGVATCRVEVFASV